MNWNQILTLLMVVEKTREQPTLKPIWDAAMKELHEAAYPKQPVRRPAEPEHPAETVRRV